MLSSFPKQKGAPVGESTHANPDAFKHTVASQLVHDEGGLHLDKDTDNKVHGNDKNGDDDVDAHLAGLLVRVGHQATHKVRLTVVLRIEKELKNMFGQKQRNRTRVDISSVRLTR